MERLQRPEGVNISKGQVRAECVERSHVAAENTGEHQRMLRMKFYITGNWIGERKNHPWIPLVARTKPRYQLEDRQILLERT